MQRRECSAVELDAQAGRGGHHHAALVEGDAAALDDVFLLPRVVRVAGRGQVGNAGRNSIGLVTPPVGTVLNVVAGVGRMKMDEVTKGGLPFMAAEFAILFLMVLFPQLVTVPAKWFGG